MRIQCRWWLLILPLLVVTVSAEDAAKSSTPSIPLETLEAGDLTLSIPKAWRKEQPSDKKRLAQLAVAPLNGDAFPAEFIVYSPISGTIETNLEQWLRQFVLEGREVVLSKGKCPWGDYVFVEISGTHYLPRGPRFARKYEKVKGYRMHGVILSAAKSGNPDENYYIKLLGPLNTVDYYSDSLRTAIGADKSMEEKFELQKKVP